MRIAYLVTRADPIGGAQIHVRDLALSVRDHGHHPAIITSGQGPLIDGFRQAGIPVYVLRHLTAPIRPVSDVRALREVRAALAEVRPDLVAAHSSKAGILGRLAGRSLRIPVVFTVHGWAFTPGVPGPRAAVYRRLERMVGPLASRLITVSEFDRRLALDARIAQPDRIVTVHNGMPDVASDLRADPTRTPPRIVMVARFEPQKDHATLIRALGGLAAQPWELDLIGEGPGMPDIRALASELGIGDRIRFLGQRMDVQRLLAQAQVATLITNWEGLPLSILEAMRAGLPVVASDVGGIGETIREGETGYLVGRGAVDRVRDRIGRLLAEPALRGNMGAAGRSLYERQFTLEHCVTRTLAVYQSVVTGPARAAAVA
ncbi:MAG TPA: glycosyltransferase family 4 protein [Gemmatimonadales bacterium]|nr:glycosyltransferase family 4 protein [Gemmatimonadales bacterium]